MSLVWPGDESPQTPAEQWQVVAVAGDCAPGAEFDDLFRRLRRHYVDLRETRPLEDLRVSADMQAIGMLHELKSDTDKALHFLINALALRQQMLGADHPRVMELREIIAGVYLLRARPVANLPRLTQSYRDTLDRPVWHWRSRRARGRLYRALWKAGLPDDAFDVFDHAIERTELNSGIHAPEAVRLRAELANRMLESYRHEGAVPLLERNVATARSTGDARQLALRCAELGFAYAAVGRTESAVTLLTAALADLEAEPAGRAAHGRLRRELRSAEQAAERIRHARSTRST